MHKAMSAWLRLISSDKAKSIRLYVASMFFWGSIVGWPVSAMTWAKDEPPFVLGLSWVAIILTAWDVLTTSQVYDEKENSGEVDR